MTALPFNRVVVGETKRELSVDQFLALPLNERVRYVLSQHIAFYDGVAPVERSIALRSLMAH
jgi:hypothetical protein